MPTVLSLPDNKTFDIDRDQTILEAALGADVPLAHACGGNAQCSTCRVWILEGLNNCEARTEKEHRLSDPLGFGAEMRLACQTKAIGDIKLRRLVLDETDLEVASQLGKTRLGPTGESRHIAVLFSDIRDFTGFSETLSAYDVMFVLNRYCFQMGEIIERNGGYVDKFIGDGIMALFGVSGDEFAPLRSVKAAVEMLDTTDKLKPYLESMYGRSFDVRIGLHYGEAVIGNLGSARQGRLTAIGDTVNVASRIEVANKEAGTRLLISEELYEQVKDHVTMDDFVRVKLRGTAERKTLYEISGVDSSALPAQHDLATQTDEVRQRLAGLEWTRVLAADDLPVGEQRVVERQELDLLIIRTEKGVYACNNACPHLHLPLRESKVTDEAIVCRWHESCFDLATGEIKRWCAGLAPDGTSEGMEYLGNISKNKHPLDVFPVRVAEGHIWVALGTKD